MSTGDALIALTFALLSVGVFIGLALVSIADALKLVSQSLDGIGCAVDRTCIKEKTMSDDRAPPDHEPDSEWSKRHAVETGEGVA